MNLLLKTKVLILLIVLTMFSATFPCNHENKCEDLRTHINKKKKIGI